jgi:DNA-binding transcriptional LysR family regulator
VSDLLEFRLLKYIVAVAETANFTRVSERLFLAQPTLNQQVIALEEGIGVRIFVRSREGIRLSAALLTASSLASSKATEAPASANIFAVA